MPCKAATSRFSKGSRLSLFASIFVLVVTFSWLSTSASQIPVPTSIEALKIELSEDKQTQLIVGWNSALASGDLSLVT
jgi:hypothetical protein